MMAKARKMLKSSLFATNSFENERFLLSTDSGGVGLQDLPFTMAYTYLEMVKSMMNENLPTGTQPLMETFTQDVGLPGYEHNHRLSKFENGPYKYSPHFDNNNSLMSKNKGATKNFFVNHFEKCLRLVNELTDSNYTFAFLPSFIPNIANMIPRDVLREDEWGTLRTIFSKHQAHQRTSRLLIGMLNNTQA
jgi:hypothetical protein